MSMDTRTDTQSPALHVADGHEPIRVHGARENNVRTPASSSRRAGYGVTGFSCASGSQDGAGPRARKGLDGDAGASRLLEHQVRPALLAAPAAGDDVDAVARAADGLAGAAFALGSHDVAPRSSWVASQTSASSCSR